MEFDVVAIIVTYNSDIDHLNRTLRHLTSQCRVVIVDNSTQDSFRVKIQEASFKAGAAFLPLGDNFGIAHAQNVGIAWAREHAAVDVLMMDDDSVPTESFVADLLEVRKKLRSYSVVVSARTISEAGVDISNRSPGKLEICTSCSELTSSGSLIPISVIDEVGPFSDRLFIDCVDFEWGWRAQALGIELILCNDVFIQHRLGEGSKFGFKIPSPIRHYYQYRNVLRMIFQSKAPLRWRLTQLVKLSIKVILIALLADRRTVRLRYAFYGIYDFLVGRYGKFAH